MDSLLTPATIHKAHLQQLERLLEAVVVQLALGVVRMRGRERARQCCSPKTAVSRQQAADSR
jgi:hypothetical protein